jgi:tRNA nucleotidyltransferase (CCA-adding enzyme)
LHSLSGACDAGSAAEVHLKRGSEKIGPSRAVEVMMRWRVSQKIIKEVTALVENQVTKHTIGSSDADLRRLVARVGPELHNDLLDLACACRFSSGEPGFTIEEIDGLRSRIAGLLETKPALKIKDLAINGNDVREMLGVPPGPMVGKILGDIHQKVLDDPGLNERHILLDLVQKEFHCMYDEQKKSCMKI